MWGGGELAGSMQMDRRFMFMKKNVCLCPEGYIHVYDHNIQTSSSLKPLGQSKSNFMWSVVIVYINGSGHLTKMAAIAINSKSLYKSYSSEPKDL